MAKVKDVLPHEIASLAHKLGFLDEVKYRDYCIREEAERMKKDGYSVGKIEFELSEKYTLTTDSIHKIIYAQN